MLDGVVLKRKTGAGAIRRPVVVALGLRADGKKEIIDFHLASSESAAEAYLAMLPEGDTQPKAHELLALARRQGATDFPTGRIGR